MKIIKPMLLSYQDEATSLEDWMYEPKFDGIRLLVGNAYSYTRHGTVTTSRFPELLFGGHETLLDGELIAPGTNAPDDFAGVMSRFSGNKEQPILYMVFDILKYKNKTTSHWPIEKRKELLTETVITIDSLYIKLVPSVYIEGEQLFEVMKANNMEGMVAKRLGSSYIPGTRSDNWKKIINWSYHDVVVSKVTFKPLTAQFSSIDGEYIGSVAIGFTKEIREVLTSRQTPFGVRVKARGWTNQGKLRLPQIIAIK